MKLRKILSVSALSSMMALSVSAVSAFECKVKEASMAKPGGFPDRALTMIVPYGPAGGSGQIAAAMAEAVTELTGVSINRDHKSGGSGTVGMTAYMAAPMTAIQFLSILMTLHQPMHLTRASHILAGFNSASNCSSNIFTNLYKIQ